ncbi:type VII secretion target [Saccharothrix obliqua]|uniref:type VII secretion target n=1 Tax=Saccharothrix obliqua TaxID=2861747 RepID=UPI001C5E71FA|nr:type VII secretion target [Saccharothrix obliqua]MBW4720840.1 ESX-1 secretion-associated protein [Saccharothrix obliqua]
MTGYEALPGDLRAHAAKLNALADRLGEAVRAARAVSMADDAYGQLCQFLPALMRDLEDLASDALTAGAKGMADTATKVRNTADEYERREDDASVLFGIVR